MLPARAQLKFIADFVARFERSDSMMRPVADYQSQYITIIALLRSVAHVFEKVDCSEGSRRTWSAAHWKNWKQPSIFREFIEPTRNVLLKEFQGGLHLRNDAFGTTVVVADPAVPGGISHHVDFEPSKLIDVHGRPILPQIHQALAFWDACLREAEAALPASAS